MLLYLVLHADNVNENQWDVVQLLCVIAAISLKFCWSFIFGTLFSIISYSKEHWIKVTYWFCSPDLLSVRGIRFYFRGFLMCSQTNHRISLRISNRFLNHEWGFRKQYMKTRNTTRKRKGKGYHCGVREETRE